MRSRHTLASPQRAARARRALASLKQAARVGLSVALLAPGLLFGSAPPAAAQVRTTTLSGPVSVRQVSSTPTRQDSSRRKQMPVEQLPPGQAVVVNFQQMSELLARSPARNGGPQKRAIHSPGRGPVWPSLPTNGMSTMSGGFTTNAPTQTNAPSPSPSQSFLAQEDGPRVGTGTFTIPPDTMGAVGLDKVFTQTNANFRIHNKVTGLPLSTVNAETFWSATGASDVFDPRVIYDPYNNRWITAIVSNASSSASSVLVGVSTTSDPQGSYLLYRFVVGAGVGSAAPFGNGGWADFPMLGFNKNWIAVGYNMHAITNNLFIRGETLIMDYPSARAGVASAARVNLGGNFCIHPATTLSPTEDVLYLLQQADPATAGLVVYTISGTPSSISVAQFGIFTRPGGGWVEPIGDILPQNCIPGSPVPTFACPSPPRKLETSDSHIRGNVVFRNGKLWYSQTVGINLPGGDDVDHTAAQWTAMTPALSAGPSLSLTFNDGGRVEDATATAANGGRWYAYTSIAVNRKDDVLLGFSEFESDDFVDAAYSFRAAGDAAGTMRDPVVFKEGEDYYDKDFGTGRNRFGDYSHAVVDPVNDLDLWTIQEYTQPRVVAVPPNINNPANGLGQNSSRWSTWWAKLALAVPAGEGDLVISEYRLRGPGGAEDEYVEIHNRTENDITVTTTDGSAGYALAASDGVVRFVIPNGTTIPARGHFLGANADGYSLSNYPAGSPAATATPDATYNENIPDGGTGESGLNRGIALFNTADTGSFLMDNRLDAVGPTIETNPLYKEGPGHPTITSGNFEQAWVRDNCGKGGNLAAFGPCPSNGAVVDNDNNAADFYYVEVSAIDVGAGQRIGAPGPENLSSPIRSDDRFAGFLLDQTKSSTAVPNRVRTQCPTAPECANPAVAQFGTMELRRRLVNNTGGVVNRLRFRIVDTVTAPAAPNRADIRALTSADKSGISIDDPATCGALQVPPASQPTPTCTVTIRGLTLEQSSPTQQPFGGGFNSSLSADSVTITPLAPGQSINIRIVLGVMAPGSFRFLISIEALP